MTSGFEGLAPAVVGGDGLRNRRVDREDPDESGQAEGIIRSEPITRRSEPSCRRAFTATELTAIALALDTSIPALFLADANEERIELPGRAIPSEDYRGVLLHADKDTPWTASRN